MKQVSSTAIALLSFFFSFAAPVNTASTGRWNATATWSQGRLPVDGDTVVIPSGVTVTIDANLNTNYNWFIKIFGALKFNGGKLDMGVASKIYVYSTGSISGSGASDALRINNIDKYRGNDPTITGPAYATSATPVAPSGFTFTTNAALPVVFIGFNIARQNSDVLVQWSTAQEVNAARFDIERSEDGSNWNTVGSLTAAGNSTTVQSYSYTDHNVAKAYYRIKQVDQDNRFTYTEVKSIKAGNTAANAKVAAVSQSKMVLQFNQQINSTVSVRIIALNGAVVAQQEISKPIGQVVVNTPSLRGNYIVSITNNQDVNSSTQILF